MKSTDLDKAVMQCSIVSKQAVTNSIPVSYAATPAKVQDTAQSILEPIKTESPQNLSRVQSSQVKERNDRSGKTPTPFKNETERENSKEKEPILPAPAIKFRGGSSR